jgi:hypothetical protein
MGLDYIRSRAGRSYVKRWARGLDRLKSPTFFDEPLPECSRVLTAQLHDGCVVRTGEDYVVQSNADGGLVLYSGHAPVGSIPNAPIDVQQHVAEQDGCALVTVERISAVGATVELRVK